jgi:hypothetical protein
MLEVLLDDPLLRVTLDVDAGMVRYERTEQPYPSIGELRRVHDALAAVAARLPHGRYAILLDVRRAPPRNDDDYETTIEAYIDLLMRQFQPSAVLVRTAAGRLQVNRLERRAARAASPVFHDEAEALAYLGVPSP